MGEKRIENQQLLAVNAPDKWVTVFTDDNFPMKVKSRGGGGSFMLVLADMLS